MTKIARATTAGAAALSLAAVALASPADAVGVHGPQFPGGQGGFHHPGSGCRDGAAGRHRRGSHRDHLWRGGFDGGGLY